eukprot:gene5972-9971_t
MHKAFVLQISPVNWAIITTLIVLVGLTGLIIIFLGMINACFPRKLDYREPPAEVRPSNSRALLLYHLKKFFQVPNWRNRLLPFLFAVYWLAMCGYINIAANIYVQNVMIQEDKGAYAPLRDIGFTFLPYLNWPGGANLVMTSWIIATIVNSLFQKKFSGFLIILRRIFLIQGTIYIIRAMSISSTILPNPDSECKPQYFNNFFHATFLFFAGQVETCYDCLFSGHTVTIVICALAIFTYTDHKVLKWLTVPPCILSLMIIIATRFHYTVDVFYGALIAFSMFNIYHFALEYIRDLLERGSNFERESTSLRLFANFVVWEECWSHLRDQNYFDTKAFVNSPIEIEDNENIYTAVPLSDPHLE